MKKLNLGSGMRKLEGYINIDSRVECDPDMVFDLETCNGNRNWGFDESSLDEVRAYDIMEHFHQDKVIFVLSEIHRVLKPGGIFDFFIPSTEGIGAFMDPTHRSYWNIGSMLYFVHPDWHALYPDWPFFNVVKQIRRVITDKELQLIHITGQITPVKERV
jgi:predicted SAM-dependent methyltransferase